jgi:eukaryotic-like serine/threonine-protein kinase
VQSDSSIARSPNWRCGTPEQAKGKVADSRSDIWAFGVVLYEMLARKPPFQGETVVEILGGMLKAEPDWRAVPGTTPGNILLLLRQLGKLDVRSLL